VHILFIFNTRHLSHCRSMTCMMYIPAVGATSAGSHSNRGGIAGRVLEDDGIVGATAAPPDPNNT
jgi:hypothetical protein